MKGYRCSTWRKYKSEYGNKVICQKSKYTRMPKNELGIFMSPVSGRRQKSIFYEVTNEV